VCVVLQADPWCAAGWNETSDVLLLRAGTHCHAPACIGTDLYVCPVDADKQGFCNESNAKLLCSNRPTYVPVVRDLFLLLPTAAVLCCCLVAAVVVVIVVVVFVVVVCSK
jgi:hypothetical protein